MSSPSTSQAPPESSESQDTTEISFTVKAANDAKYPISLAPTTAIKDLKAKLAELADVPADRQRLIYSGRVMKDEETLAFYKVQSGHTIHMVKGAASNVRQNASASAAGGATNAPGIPTNIAAGSGNNPLAGLTGARYAGLAPLPNADIFGPDGGMGPPADTDQMLSIMQTPGFQSTMNEMLQNPQMLDYIISSNPALRNMPGAREMMQTREFREMMTNPEMLRQASAMQRLLGGGRPGLGNAAPLFPEPGRTDTTPAAPAQPNTTTSPQQTSTGSLPTGAAGNPFGASPANPFAGLFGFPGIGTPQQPGAADGTTQQPPQGAAASPLGLPPLDWARLADVLRRAHSPPPPGSGGTQGATGTNSPPFNPFSMFGLPPLAASPPPPVDNRPPEERYAEQLRQLNDMGFYDFDRNIEALRRTGGSVQGAIQHLLGD